MLEGMELQCKATLGGLFVLCPYCRRGRLLRIEPTTTAFDLVTYCRSCKRECVLNIAAGTEQSRVKLSKNGANLPLFCGGS